MGVKVPIHPQRFYPHPTPPPARGREWGGNEVSKFLLYSLTAGTLRHTPQIIQARKAVMNEGQPGQYRSEQVQQWHKLKEAG